MLSALSGIRALVLGLFIVGPVDAQEGTLRGVVVDTAGEPIPRADVSIVVLRQLTRTDDSGRFVLTRVPLGDAELSVRRLSFVAAKVRVVVGTAGTDTVRVILRPAIALLDGVNISAGQLRRREEIEEFYRRRSRGLGAFITRDEIEGRASGSPSDMLRSVPGIRFVKVGSGRGVRFPTTSLSRRDCAPMIWIDGQKAPGLEIDDVTLTDIEGIEIYNGPSTTPFQFSQGTGGTTPTCGTIVIWSRPPTPRSR